MDKQNPSHQKETHRINRIIGQLEGIKKMIESERYCPDILTQTKAISSSIRSLETAILEKHIHCCVKVALKSNQSSDEKINELIDIFKKRIK